MRASAVVMICLIDDLPAVWAMKVRHMNLAERLEWRMTMKVVLALGASTAGRCHKGHRGDPTC